MILQSLLILAGSVALMSWASGRLTTSLERVGARWKFSEGLLGIVTALGADAPETFSAIAAIWVGEREVGVGVVLGSNIFNLAGLLGLSALVAGRVSIGRRGLWFNGGTGIVVTMIAVVLVMQWISVGLSLVLLTILLVPYVAITSMRSSQIQRLPLPRPVRGWLDSASGHIHGNASKREHISPATWVDGVWIGVALTLIIATSIGMVHTAVDLAGRWGISDAIVGVLILAALTSIPNVVAAIQLARQGRGAAVVSESLNSNTMNILVGVCLPALFLGFTAPAGQIIFTACWLLGMKLIAVLACSPRGGLQRSGGAILVVLYLIYAGVIILRGVTG